MVVKSMSGASGVRFGFGKTSYAGKTSDEALLSYSSAVPVLCNERLEGLLREAASARARRSALTPPPSRAASRSARSASGSSAAIAPSGDDALRLEVASDPLVAVPLRREVGRPVARRSARRRRSRRARARRSPASAPPRRRRPARASPSSDAAEWSRRASACDRAVERPHRLALAGHATPRPPPRPRPAPAPRRPPRQPRPSSWRPSPGRPARRAAAAARRRPGRRRAAPGCAGGSLSVTSGCSRRNAVAFRRP